METGRRRLPLFATLLGIALSAQGCSQGKVLLMRMEFERPSVPTVGARAVIRGVPRTQSNKYQAMFEAQLVRGIEDSGLFASVAREDPAAGPFDLSIQIQPAIAAFDRRVNMAYFPLALATLTLYIWVGGPIGTDTEFYDVTLRVDEASGRHLFDVSSRREYTHWVNLYSKEYASPRCAGPHAGEMIAGLVNELASRLASSGWKSADAAGVGSR